ncbi:TetR family transcriptional regulator [Antrihabitans stalactiti]|uniref:TetR family transcriptional regulator n=1 Tax=Antrihabitans stalactiti TaxID=2584121 RepID=UPI0014699EBF
MKPAQRSVDEVSVDDAPVLDSYAEVILTAARGLLVRHGLRRTSLADIAKSAKVAPATLYRRFPTREALLESLLVREAQEVLAHVDAAVADLDDPEEALVAAFLVFTRSLREHDLLQAFIESDPDRVLPMLTTSGAPYLALGKGFLAARLVEARDRGAKLTAEPEILAEIFMRIAQSFILTTDTALPLDDDRAVSDIAKATFARLAFHRTDD